MRSRQGRVYITKYVESGCTFSSKLKARVPEGREAGVLRWGAGRSSHLWDEMASVRVTGKTPHHPPPATAQDYSGNKSTQTMLCKDRAVLWGPPLLARACRFGAVPGSILDVT